jgi:hypothetical protein
MPDRRLFSWRTVAYGYLRSRRHSHRRVTEAAPVFIDRHHPWLFFLATGTMLMSSIDAYFTLKLLDRGAVELNPVMALAMEYGTGSFAASKMLLTALGILTLVFLSRSRLFNRFRTGLVLTTFFCLYACLICYQITLLMR